MSKALVLDMIHGLPPTCIKSWENQVAGLLSLNEEDTGVHVFLLCGADSPQTDGRSPETYFTTRYNWTRSMHVLDYGTLTECLYIFKTKVDKLDLCSVQVITSDYGRAVLELYQQELFTAVYTFKYEVVKIDDSMCSGCNSATTASPVPTSGIVTREVANFLQQVPSQCGDVTILKSTLIPDCFSHGFSTRTGGVSSIPTLSSLNLFCSSRRRDPRALVAENLRRLALEAGFHPRPLHLVKVNHASDVWVMGKAEPESYDAIVTNQRDVVIAAPGADCMPILFTDPVSKVIGAAHAGWKGTLMGVAMATVDAMAREFGSQRSDVTVAIGPSVGKCCFTLWREQAREFHSIHPDCVPDLETERPHVDIRLATRILLERGGVRPESIHDHTVTDRPCVTPCTSCHPESFFSHVRDGLNFGTQVGFLWMDSRGIGVVRSANTTFSSV